MALFCIPKQFVGELKKTALANDVQVNKIIQMSSKQRREYFSKFVNEETSKFINVKFEEALISQRESALLDWAQSVFSPIEKTKPRYKNVLDKIEALKADGALSDEGLDNYLEDLVSERFGVSISEKEAKKITSLANGIQEKQLALGDGFGSIAKKKETIDFLNANKEMDDYLKGLAPSKNREVFFSTIGRGTMLASIKSPILNIGSNSIIGITEAMARRFNNVSIGNTLSKEAVDYVKMVNEIYQKTGYDISRMVSIDELVAGGGKTLGELVVHSQGKGVIRKIGRFFEMTVFKQLMGAPDVAFSSAHFADSAMMSANKLAKGNDALAKEIFADATKISPVTKEGIEIRQKAIADAMYATYTNDSVSSKIASAIRGLFNQYSGGMRVGDAIFPFVKTPANVVEAGLDYSGLGFVKSAWELSKMIRTGQARGIKDYAKILFLSKGSVRAGIGMTAAIAIASGLDTDDFIGAYDPQRAQVEQLKNTNYNAIRIGNKWISMDWFGPLAAPITGMLYARKYGKDQNAATKAFGYIKSSAQQATRLPVVSQIIDNLSKRSYVKDKQLDLMEFGRTTVDGALAFFSSRIIPSFVSDLAKAGDQYQRESDTEFNKIMAKIPWVRNQMPKKYTLLGEPMKDEPAWANILFGSRLKTEIDSEVENEIYRLANQGEVLSLTDWKKTTSSVVAGIKEKQTPERFNELKVEYGQEVKKEFNKIINSKEYKKASEADKKSLLDKKEAEVLKEFGVKYGKEKKKKKSSGLPTRPSVAEGFMARPKIS